MLSSVELVQSHDLRLGHLSVVCQYVFGVLHVLRVPSVIIHIFLIRHSLHNIHAVIRSVRVLPFGKYFGREYMILLFLE
jgi:hypothetical protein